MNVVFVFLKSVMSSLLAHYNYSDGWTRSRVGVARAIVMLGFSPE